MDETIRIDKFIANNGYTARRDVEKFLKNHVVTLDGKRVSEAGVRFNPTKEILLIDGKSVKEPQKQYIILHKPEGILSTAADERGRKTVIDLVKSDIRLFPVGRLDKDTTGLILLTNDGDMMNKLIHPRFHVPKTYVLTVNGIVPLSLQKNSKRVFS
jgi:23S rRNA pseudouridine2605 synthase